MKVPDNQHCVKSVRISSFSVPYFPTFGLNKDQKNSEYGHFSHSANITVWAVNRHCATTMQTYMKKEKKKKKTFLHGFKKD